MQIINKQARHDYTIADTLEAGIKLTGSEVKSVKSGRMLLAGAYVKIINNDVLLINANIPRYQYSPHETSDPKRTRKLLLHKNEILKLKSKTERGGLTILPLKCYTKHGLVKIEIGIGRGKKQYEKREELKKKATERELERIIRGKI